MRKLAMIGICLLALFTGCKNDDDEVIRLTELAAILSGANEVPVNTSPATGRAEGTFDEETNELDLIVTYQQMTPTAWHIHEAPEGTNGSVLFDLGKTFTSPYSYSTTLTAEQEADLKAGLYYVNIHSATFPGGEIRGQLKVIP